jgi:ribosomal protein S18 acetylase RimI-like enzyme
MADVVIKQIETASELWEALALCYRVLGERNDELYGPDAWARRFENGLQPLVIAVKEDRIVSAVLGRAENAESLVIGFVACDENYRRQGITSALMCYFEELARAMQFQYITLGSRQDAFYEKCGYRIKFRIHEQNIYQKRLT